MPEPTARQPPGEAAANFVAALQALKPPDLALLRRATGKPLGQNGPVYDVFFYGLWHTVRLKYATASRWAAWFVATLYPWHPQPDGKGNLGECLRRIPFSDARAKERADKRFRRLLDSRDQRALYAELAAAVRRLAKAEVPVDWAQLLDDLAAWYEPGHPIQHAWAETYFNA